MLGFATVPGLDLNKFISNLQMCRPWFSLGDVETLVLLVGEDVKHGIPSNYVRVSVGLEAPEDIIADFKQAFDKA